FLPYSHGAAIPIQFASPPRFNTASILRQLFPERTQGIQTHRPWVAFPASQLRTVHISVWIFLDQKAIGHIQTALAFPLPFDVLYISYTSLTALGHTEIAHFPALFI